MISRLTALLFCLTIGLVFFHPGYSAVAQERKSSPQGTAHAHDDHAHGHDDGHEHGHAHDHGHAHSKAEADLSDASHEPAASSLPGARGPALTLAAYCVLLVCASLVGGWLPQWLHLSHTRMQTIVSLVGGLMLGIAVFHMLPHSLFMLEERGPDVAAGWMMAGLLVMFFLLRVFHFHQHGTAETPDADGLMLCAHEHDHDHDHGRHEPGQSHAPVHPPHAHRLSWVGVFTGLALHTFVDGLALGASVEADAAHGGGLFVGIGTFLAIFLHIPLDSISITSLMAASGYKPLARNLVNVGFASLCPLGAALFVLGVQQLAGRQEQVVGSALAFSAGVFLCIALSDLLPEMEFHSHNRLRLTLALLVGVAIAWGIGFLEPAHVHSHHHAGHSHGN